MKKCPRCKKDVADRYQYCPYCGMNLEQKPDRHRLLYYFIIFFVPIMYYLSLSNNQLPDSSNKLVLEEVSNRQATTISYQFSSLETFTEKVEDTDEYIQTIKDYEATIHPDASKEYLISILDNHDVNFKLLYSFIESDIFVDIHKQYTRSGNLDYLEHAFTQKGISKLSDIIINKDTIGKYVEDITELETLYNQLLLREEEFNKKIENIGHFGFGEYSDDASIVVYPDGNSFKVVLKMKEMKKSEV